MALIYESYFQLYRVSSMGPFNNNGYVIADPISRECYLVDAPAEFGRLLDEAKGFKIKGVLITHTHPDHIAGYPDLMRSIAAGHLDAVIGVHSADASRLPVQPSHELVHGEVLCVGRTSIRIRHTPGHTAGGVCLELDGCLISGDTLFPGGPGYTRTPDDFQQVVQSITAHIHSLDERVLILPGHGVETTVGVSKQEYRTFMSKPHQSDLHGEVHWLDS